MALLPVLIAVAAAPAGGAEPAHPAVKLNRWQEDWSALAEPARRTRPLDRLKHLPLGDAGYLTLGATLRERFETNDAADFGVRDRGDAWLQQRLQVHADARLGQRWQAFAQIEDVRSLGKQDLGVADQNRLDLRLAFVAYVKETPSGAFKARIGRQDPAFDLQRFVSSRDGPAVRQSFDAVWADWEHGPWRVLGFVSQPVRYRDDRAFDDTSSGDFRLDFFRVERHVQGDNELSAFYARYARSSARYLDAAGEEERHVLDVRYAGSAGALDWDLEAMGQSGAVGPAKARAWGLGARAGYRFTSVPWAPRLGLQADAASGDDRAGDSVLEVFNPLFPNGFYFTKAGYTGYANLLHLKPSIAVRPSARLNLQLAVAGQWRQTTADAIYTAPNIALPGSAGVGGRRTGAYGQLLVDYRFRPGLNGTLEAVRYAAGPGLRAIDGRNSNYLGVELKYGW